ncbi:MAG: hypothetical protein PVH73_09300 [Candidatus Bathyarchaeota archaeon]
MKLSKRLFLFGLVLLVLISCPSVGASSEVWSRTYGGIEVEEAYSLVEASDGGYVLAGDGGLFVKTDEHGGVDWTRAYEGYSLVATSDGGYALAGFTSSYTEQSDFRLIKIDANGNRKWTKTYGESETEQAYALVETPDNGYAIAGRTYSSGAGRSDFWLVKTDMYGNMEWNRTYGGEQFDCAYSVIVTSDGGFALVGYKDWQDNYVGADFWLIKTDASGNMLWKQTYDRMVDKVYCVIETADAGFALAGATGFWSDTDIWVVKTDEYGNMLWNRTYGVGAARAIVELSDGNYVVAGGNRLIKTDAYGNTVWSRTYDAERVNSVIKTSDGGYALAGTKNNDFWIAKTDENGIIPELHPPYICIDSSQNVTYPTDNVSLTFTVNEETTWMSYSLDGQDNVTITETALNLAELADGSHNMTVYATDTDGNTAASETISFTVAKEVEPPLTKDDETTTDWTPFIIVTIAVAIAIVAVILYFTKKRKTTHKN